MGRILLAFRCFFSILFHGRVSEESARRLGLEKPKAAAKPAAPAPTVRLSDGAIQLLAVLQRDARLVDFLMEDISGYADDQVGAAVRSLHEQCRQSLGRYVRLTPVIDGVEGTYMKLEPGRGPDTVKLLGNVPPDGRAPGGILRHKGWRADKVDLPPAASGKEPGIVGPAEIEIE